MGYLLGDLRFLTVTHNGRMNKKTGKILPETRKTEFRQVSWTHFTCCTFQKGFTGKGFAHGPVCPVFLCITYCQ